MSEIKTYDLDKGVKLSLCKSNKFKSVLISVRIYRNLRREEVTINSLLTNVLSSGCNKYKTIKDLSLREDELYGLSISNYVMKMGEKFLSTFRFLFVADKYLDEPIFDSAFELCRDLILDPFVVCGKLNPDIIEVEKENLKEDIESKIDSKSYYALFKCIEHMCEDEIYQIDETGYIDDIDKIDSKKLYEAYKKFLSTSNVHISIEGNFSEERALELAKKYMKFDRGNIDTIKREEFISYPSEVKYFEEDLNLNKANLCIGFRTNVDYMDFRRYYSLLVANSIFGSGSNSKLFNNIREKESLCYYISSSLEKQKGLLMVNAGIDKDNSEKVLGMIRKELDDVKKGEFTDLDVEFAKRITLNSIKSSYNSFSGVSSFGFNQYLSKTNLSIEDVIEYISNTTRKDIIDSVKDVMEDTVFLLK